MILLSTTHSALVDNQSITILYIHALYVRLTILISVTNFTRFSTYTYELIKPFKCANVSFFKYKDKDLLSIWFLKKTIEITHLKILMPVHELLSKI